MSDLIERDPLPAAVADDPRLDPWSFTAQPPRRHHVFWALVLGLGIGIGLGYPFDAERETPAGLTLDRVLSQIEAKYVREVDVDELFTRGVNDMLKSLDRNSTYVPPKGAEEFEGDTEGFYVGIGVVLDREDHPDEPVIRSVIAGGPAERAGLQAGDLIVGVDGRSIEGRTVQDVHALIQGAPGTRLSLAVKRGGSDEVAFLVERQRVSLPSVQGLRVYRTESGSGEVVGYLRLDQFQPDSTEEVREGLSKLQERGADRFVLDLRGNRGGVLGEAVAIVDLFVEDGVILSTRGRADLDKPTLYTATSDTPFPTQPLVVLIDKYSASASEIVAAALQDLRRAVLVGTESFGKWTVQDVIPMGEHGGILKLTTKQFRPPESRWVRQDHRGERHGIRPQVRVELDTETLSALARLQNHETWDFFQEPGRVVELPAPRFDQVQEVVDGVLVRGIAVVTRSDDYLLLLATDPDPMPVQTPSTEAAEPRESSGDSEDADSAKVEPAVGDPGGAKVDDPGDGSGGGR